MKHSLQSPSVQEVPALTGNIDILRQRIDTALMTSREIALKLNQFDGEQCAQPEAPFPPMPTVLSEMTVLHKLSCMNDLISMVNDELTSIMGRLAKLV